MIDFVKKNDIYKIIRITGNQNNILGIVFNTKSTTTNQIEVTEWDFPELEIPNQTRTSKQEVLNQVLIGLKNVNESLGTNYKFSKIYFVPYDLSKGGIYSRLTATLVRHYHHGHEFKEQ